MDMDTLKAECLACTRCELCTTRTNVVFGQGVPDAEVLFVGEGPGQSEDEQGLPFVGRSGQLLSSAARPRTATRCPPRAKPVCRGCGSSSGCCSPRSWSALGALPPSG